MSDEQHTWDAKHLSAAHHEAADSNGGRCLNSHPPVDYRENKSCSYRWQGYVRAGEKDNLQYYLWPASASLQPPTRGAWDWGHGENYKKASQPFANEAHHIVPDAEFRSAIASVGSGSPLEHEITCLVREGLLEEGYNLNHRVNIIILPMTLAHSRAVGLPKHRLTFTTFHHSAYSKYVRDELDKIFSPMQERVDECPDKRPVYRKCRKQLDGLSALLHERIVEAGRLMKQKLMQGDSLDHIPEQHFEPQTPQN